MSEENSTEYFQEEKEKKFIIDLLNDLEIFPQRKARKERKAEEERRIAEKERIAEEKKKAEKEEKLKKKKKYPEWRIISRIKELFHANNHGCWQIAWFNVTCISLFGGIILLWLGIDISNFFDFQTSGIYIIIGIILSVVFLISFSLFIIYKVIPFFKYRL